MIQYVNILHLDPLLIFGTIGFYPGSVGRSRGSTMEKLFCLNRDRTRGESKTFYSENSFVGLLFVLEVSRWVKAAHTGGFFFFFPKSEWTWNL